jgi:hypothetical protein
MPDIHQAAQDLAKALKELEAIRKEEDAARKDEEAKLRAMQAASSAVMRAKGKEALRAAGRESHDAEDAWRAANSKRKELTLKRMLAEKKARKAMRQFTEAVLKIIFP